MEIACRFFKYFTNTGSSLARSILSVNPSFRFYLGDDNHPSISLQPTTISELESICGMFPLKKAPGYDTISIHVIKHSLHPISGPLADIINVSLLKGIFLDKLKIVKIIPIHKAEDPGFFVSNFSNFFFFWENNIRSLHRICQKHDILYCFYFGCWKNHSTSHSLIHLVIGIVLPLQ